MAKRTGVGWLLLKSALYGLTGFVLVPAVLFLLVLGLAYAFDPRCGSPDASGCGSGAGAIALASAVPAFALCFLVSVAVAFARQRRGEPDFAAVLDRTVPAETSGLTQRNDGTAPPA
ncbi:hypothetical protein [Aquibium oceanicum]|uniref:Uncharacterized protein n=1 Tax=Aquibium oceanicum TaxID=1670800 RepID=A0A1L3SWM6_9HYPH|nr:hypothetical protein [Aquibium oceanicum]APH73843.1 hypothetical protein BSQ44_22510 [Aquibium oceanicum]